MSWDVQVKKLSGTDDLPLPRKMTDLSSGFDLFANLDETMTLKPGERTLVPTGVSLAMPPELEAQIRPRSGLALKKGITSLNAPGTIDADYRGEIGVILINHGAEAFDIERGERIAQLVFQHVPSVDLKLVDELSETVRGDGGFGHTGV